MTHPGRSPFKGQNYQTLAALALFLQYLKNPTFLCIQMETPGSIDFSLVFADGHKIMCEAKDRKDGVDDSRLKTIVRKLQESKIVGEEDEILIVCSLCKTNTFEQIETLRFWPQEVLENELAKKGYERELGKLLSKLRVWEQTRSKLEDIVYLLFSEAIDFWLPQEDIEEVVRSILLESFHWGSAEGNSYKREDITREIESQAARAKERSTIFNETRTSYEKQIDKIDAAVKEGNLNAGHSEIAALSQDRALMYFLLNKLKAKKNIRLADWKNVWHACKIYYPLQIFDIFRANISNKEKRAFILSFIENSLDQLNTFYFDTFFENGLAKLLTAIAQKDNSLHLPVLSILKAQLGKYDHELFYLSAHEEKLHRKSDLSGTLESLYEKSTKDMKEQIYEFITNTFNVIEDEEDYSLYTPREIFRILKQYLNDNNNEFFEQRFSEMTSKLAMQHEKFYRYKFHYDFKGWDAIGSTRAFCGHDYSVSEKQFIQYTLIPALRNFDCEARWTFIKENCVVEPQEVSKQRPDFLNRVAIPFVLEEYGADNAEALPILKKYVLSSRHDSDKNDFIYQFLKKGKFTDEQRWNLARITVDSLTLSPLVEQIVGDLAFKGHKQAIAQIEAWASNPHYLERISFLNDNFIPNVEKLLCHAPNRAASIFKKLVANQSWIDGLNQSQVVEFCGLFARIIKKNPNEGWAIWNELKDQDFLTIKEQQLLTGALNKLHGGHSRRTLDRAFLAANALTSSYNEFATKFFSSRARELLVQFVEARAAKDEYDPLPSFEIIKRFANDVDPANGDARRDASEGLIYEQGGEGGLRSVRYVRGHAAWAIRNIVRQGIEGGMDEVIEVVRKLTTDKNLQVRELACSALAQLAATRHATTNGLRFMSKRQASQVELTAFQMLEEETNRKPSLQVALAVVFNRLQSVDFKHATKAVRYFVKASSEALKQYLKTIIFFAEIRENFGQRQKLTFTNVLLQLIEEEPAIKSQIAWRMWQLSKERSRSGRTYVAATLKYVQKIAERYDREALEFVCYFIKDHINNTEYRSEVLSIYKEFVSTESRYLTHSDCQKNKRSVFCSHGEVLQIVFAFSKEESLNLFKTLSEYPPQCDIGDISHAVDLLCKVPENLEPIARDIFENLLERNRSPMLYEKKKKWEESIRKGHA